MQQIPHSLQQILKRARQTSLTARHETHASKHFLGAALFKGRRVFVEAPNVNKSLPVAYRSTRKHAALNAYRNQHAELRVLHQAQARKIELEGKDLLVVRVLSFSTQDYVASEPCALCRAALLVHGLRRCYFINNRQQLVCETVQTGEQRVIGAVPKMPRAWSPAWQPSPYVV